MIKVRRVDALPDIWIYENFESIDFHKKISFYFSNIKENLVNNFEGRVVNYENRSFKLVDTREHRRYHKLWNFSYEPDYWQYTNHTINDYIKLKSKDLIPHVLQYLIKSILLCKPFSDYNGHWIPLRGLFNLLEPNTALDPHVDGNIYIATGPTYSATYYIDVEGDGGEFWDHRGFYYKPKNNTLLINEGSSLHGVRECSQFRTGVTIRFVKEVDLILPGNFTDLLYKPSIT